jgi:hypothetical protein
MIVTPLAWRGDPEQRSADRVLVEPVGIGQYVCVPSDGEEEPRSNPLRMRLPRVSPAIRGVPVYRATRMLAAAGFGWRVRRVDGSEPSDDDRALGQAWEADPDGVIDIVAVRVP